MNSPMPAAATSSTVFPEKSIDDAVHDVLGYPAPRERKFLAKRTPRPKPQFLGARLRTSDSPRSSDSASAQPKSRVPPSPSRGEHSRYHRTVCEKKNVAAHGKEIRLLPSDSNRTSGNTVIRSSCKQPGRQALANHLDRGKMIERAPLPPENPTSRSKPGAGRRNDQKGSISAPLVDMTRSNYLLDDDAWTLDATLRLLASEKNNSSSYRGPSIRSSPPQPVVVEDQVVHREEARPRAATSNQKSREAAVGSGPFRRPLQSKVEATKATSNINGVRKRSNRCVAATELSSAECKSGFSAQHQQFDLDAAIYGQPEAAAPPPGVQIRRQIPRKTTVPDEQRLYIHANPAINLLHNRSVTWHARKASEIESRPRRKSWFGNVSGRLRWLRANEEMLPPSESGKREDVDGINEKLPRRRALDFGDVPEDELPDYVQQNPAWLEACRFFRQTEERRAQRARVSKLCEQETQAFFDSIVDADAYHVQ
ncbi:hypothetical protein E4U42_003713 [Claviceps africana]|uniref:Uncharacterized protein n=1 Tax=Claviceps africana TaxID=83212 RepID=A0A8K0J6M7_9HYPO|nr:hypothetical protein E4U42_003713 [Claviceps africana]